MNDNPVILEIVRDYDLPAIKDEEANKQWLAAKINELLNHDFSRLVSILYRVDVNENKLRYLLIERQLQKKKSKEQFKQSDNTIDENEKW
jgi:hypothetical protein